MDRNRVKVTANQTGRQTNDIILKPALVVGVTRLLSPVQGTYLLERRAMKEHSERQGEGRSVSGS